MKILHVIPSLDFCGAAAQLGLLSKYLPHAHEMHICCLGGEKVWAARLRQHGRRVVCLNWTRVFDPTPPWKLHRLLRDLSPDVVHAWGLPALRALGLVGRRWLPRTLLSRPLPIRVEQVKPFDRWLLRRAHTVVASTQAEANLCRDAGVRELQLAVVPPGVQTVDPPHPHPLSPEAGAKGSCTGISPRGSPISPEPGARVERLPKTILCLGALEAHKGFRDAIWAFDMLHFLFADTCLKIAGDGSQRFDLERFVAALEISTCVEFLGRRDDVSQMLCDAYVCWVPTLRGTGGQVALEAMAAGCPVVAADRPGVRELIADGRTGFVVPPGDTVAMGKRTRELFLDAELRQRIGMAARDHVVEHSAPGTFGQRWAERYAAAA